MSVKRFRPYYCDPIKLTGHEATMRENLEGDYVLYADYAALATRNGPWAKCGDCGADLTNWPTSASAHQCAPCERCAEFDEVHDQHCPQHPDHDPSPWCSGCGARKKSDCHCGPIAENE